MAQVRRPKKSESHGSNAPEQSKMASKVSLGGILNKWGHTKSTTKRGSSRNVQWNAGDDAENHSYKFLKHKPRENKTRRDQLEIKMPNNKKLIKKYMFQKIFPGNTSQLEVFDAFEDVLIENSVNGVSARITPDQQLHDSVRANVFGEDFYTFWRQAYDG